MKEAASNVTTYEIPVRLQTLLGEKFSLLRLDTEGTSSQMKNVEEELNDGNETVRIATSWYQKSRRKMKAGKRIPRESRRPQNGQVQVPGKQ